MRTVSPIRLQDGALDIAITTGSARQIYILGKAGSVRELALIPSLEALRELFCEPDSLADEQHSIRALPVLIGSGTGAGLRVLVSRLVSLFGDSVPLAIVDKEIDILAVTELEKEFSRYPQIIWLSESTIHATITGLTRWQLSYEGLPLKAVVHPFYLRLDREFYATVQSICRDSAEANFWGKNKYTKFSDSVPRILLIMADYFLSGEIIAAAARLGFELRLVQVPKGEVLQQQFIQTFLHCVATFRPDFVLTLNHMGMDREGVLSDLLARLNLPFCSWFVDNPELIIAEYGQVVNDWTAILTWDQDNVPLLKKMGFNQIHYLPLGVDAQRFQPLSKHARKRHCQPDWYADVSFLGTSMVNKSAALLKRTNFPQQLLDVYKQMALAFNDSEMRSMNDFMALRYPDEYALYEQLPTVKSRLDYCILVTWEATKLYRLSCVESILPYEPLITGDDGWFDILPQTGWRHHLELNYYDDLPYYYPCSQINFNCTSKQMKGAVNQRVFDVPACGAFVLTDYRKQIENLFEPETEVICYHCPEEATALVEYYLRAPQTREQVVKAARKRILACHTYEHRLKEMYSFMKKTYGSG